MTQSEVQIAEVQREVIRNKYPMEIRIGQRVCRYRKCTKSAVIGFTHCSKHRKHGKSIRRGK